MSEYATKSKKRFSHTPPKIAAQVARLIKFCKISKAHAHQRYNIPMQTLYNWGCKYKKQLVEEPSVEAVKEIFEELDSYYQVEPTFIPNSVVISPEIDNTTNQPDKPIEKNDLVVVDMKINTSRIDAIYEHDGLTHIIMGNRVIKSQKSLMSVLSNLASNDFVVLESCLLPN